MNPGAKRFLYWSPRVLGILFALFLSLFAFDVFGVGLGLWESIRAFLIHLTPVYALVIALILAWKRAWLGAILFPALALLYVVSFGGRWDWIAYALIAGPLLLLGLLFLLNWRYRQQLQDR
jgi:hypothetical protein